MKPLHPEIKKTAERMSGYDNLIASIPVGHSRTQLLLLWALVKAGWEVKDKHILPDQPVLITQPVMIHQQTIHTANDFAGLDAESFVILEDLKSLSKVSQQRKEDRIPNKIFLTSHNLTGLVELFPVVIFNDERLNLNDPQRHKNPHSELQVRPSHNNELRLHGEPSTRNGAEDFAELEQTLAQLAA